MFNVKLRQFSWTKIKNQFLESFGLQLDVTIFVIKYPVGMGNHLNIGNISMPDNLALVLWKVFIFSFFGTVYQQKTCTEIYHYAVLILVSNP
jgi:hypothetical protein